MKKLVEFIVDVLFLLIAAILTTMAMFAWEDAGKFWKELSYKILILLQR